MPDTSNNNNNCYYCLDINAHLHDMYFVIADSKLSKKEWALWVKCTESGMFRPCDSQPLRLNWLHVHPTYPILFFGFRESKIMVTIHTCICTLTLPQGSYFIYTPLSCKHYPLVHAILGNNKYWWLHSNYNSLPLVASVLQPLLF